MLAKSISKQMGRVAVETLEPRTLLSGYSVTDLGSLGGGTTLVWKINEKGQVVGISNLHNSEIHPFLWQNGKMKDLGAVGVGTLPLATGIDDKGRVTGGALGGTSAPGPFLYDGGKLKSLASQLGGTAADAWDINNAGQIIGIAGFQSGFNVASTTGFFYSGEKLTKIPGLGGASSFPLGLSETGVAVGFAETPGQHAHAFRFSGGKITDLGAPTGSKDSGATAINGKGQIVGLAGTGFNSGALGLAGDSRAILWDSGKINMLPKINLLPMLSGDKISEAFGINDLGTIVGSSASHKPGATFNLSFPGQHATVWIKTTIGYKAQDLNKLIPAASGWTLNAALSINNKGQIIGMGDFHGNHRSFILNLLEHNA